MQTSALLSPADIQAIRTYVQTKYAELPGAKRAEMISDAIRRSLGQKLPPLPEEIKSGMTMDLVRRCLITERRPVQPDDVLDYCAELELPEAERVPLLVEPMLQWMNERFPHLWSADHITARLLKQKQSIFPEATQEQGAVIEEVTVAEQETAAEPAIHHLGESVTPAPIAVEAISAEAEAATVAAEVAVAAEPALVLQEQPVRRPLAETIGSLPRKAWIAAACVIVGGVTAALVIGMTGRQSTAATPQASSIAAPLTDIGMPQQLKYREFDAAPIKAYLRSRDGLLAEEPYFSAIVKSAKTHDVNPLLLFAIVGQEQGFVPKSNENAKQIANNPFNVFHSWHEYNTDIQDSSDIAARTISRRGKIRPQGHEPFSWFNKTYAEDPNWGNGVKQLFDKLTSLSPSR